MSVFDVEQANSPTTDNHRYVKSGQGAAQGPATGRQTAATAWWQAALPPVDGHDLTRHPNGVWTHHATCACAQGPMLVTTRAQWARLRKATAQ